MFDKARIKLNAKKKTLQDNIEIEIASDMLAGLMAFYTKQLNEFCEMFELDRESMFAFTCDTMKESGWKD